MMLYGKRFIWQLRSILLLLVTFGLTTIVANGCGGGSNDNGSAPSITDMGVTGNRNVLSVSLEWKDIDGDLSSISTYFNNSAGSLIGDFTDAIDDINSNKSGILSGDLDLSSLDTGDYSINIYLSDLKGNKSNTMTREFSIEGGFGDEVDYKLSDYTRPEDTAIGDLNSDGRNDIIALVPNRGTILTYYQNISGSMDTPVSINLEDEYDISLHGLVIADINNDGTDDIITCTNYDEIIMILQDPVSGNLQSPQIIKSNMITSAMFAVADLNGDHLNDLIMFQGYSFIDIGTNYAIFFQNIDGSFGPEVDGHIDGISCHDLRVADMNNDGNPDIVMKNFNNQLVIIKQMSPGVLSTTPDIYTVTGGNGGYPAFSSFELGDLNGDGLTDMATVSDNYINIFLQNPQGMLNDPVVLQPELQPFGMEIADITGDGLNDLVMDASGYIVLFPQLSNHSFSISNYTRYYNSSPVWGGSSVTRALSIGDVTGDGKPDAVVSWSTEIFVYPYSKEVILKEE